MNARVKKIYSIFWLAACILLSLVGIAAFIFLFIPIINVFWFIVSPVILAMYQIPAVYLFRRWKKWKARSLDMNERQES